MGVNNPRLLVGVTGPPMSFYLAKIGLSWVGVRRALTISHQLGNANDPPSLFYTKPWVIWRVARALTHFQLFRDRQSA